MRFILFSILLFSLNSMAADIHGCWYEKGFSGSDGFYIPDQLMCFHPDGKVDSKTIEPGKLQYRVLEGNYTLNGNLLQLSSPTHYTKCPDELVVTDPTDATYGVNNNLLTINLFETPTFPAASFSLRKATDSDKKHFEKLEEGCN